MSMMVKTGTPARYMAIAAADRSEWVPTSVAEYPRASLPMHVTTARMLMRTCLEVTQSSFRVSGWMYVLMGVEGVASGYARIQEQTAAQLRTGQSMRSWVRCMVVMDEREPARTSNEIVSEIGGNPGHIAPMGRVSGAAESKP